MRRFRELYANLPEEVKLRAKREDARWDRPEYPLGPPVRTGHEACPTQLTER